MILNSKTFISFDIQPKIERGCLSFLMSLAYVPKFLCYHTRFLEEVVAFLFALHTHAELLPRGILCTRTAKTTYCHQRGIRLPTTWTAVYATAMCN